MERDFLKDLGLNDDQLKKVMAQYGKDVQQFKGDQDKLTKLEETNKDLEGQLKQRDSQLNDLKKQAGDNADLKEKFDKAIADNKQQAKDFKAQLAAKDKRYAISNSLRDAGARNAKAVEALLDLDKVSLDDNGNLIGLSDQLEAVKKSDSYLFNSTDSDTPKPTPAPKVVHGGNPNDDSNKGGIDLATASYQDILKYKRDHPKDYERLEEKEDL